MFNQFFHYHPHKVTFCISRFSGEAQNWWEVATRELGENANEDQQYLTYADFKAEVRRQFWKTLKSSTPNGKSSANRTSQMATCSSKNLNPLCLKPEYSATNE